MSKQITLTLRDWVYDTYLRNYGGSNRSSFVEEMFLKGIDKTDAPSMDYKTKLFELNCNIRELEEKLKQLKAINARYFKALGGKTPEEKEAEQIAKDKQTRIHMENDAIRDSGFIEDILDLPKSMRRKI